LNVRKQITTYFEHAGFLNTTPVIDAVEERLKLKDIDTVVVPVSSGRTASQFFDRLDRYSNIVTISEDEAVSACKRIAYSSEGLLGKLVQSRLEEVSGKVDKLLRREAFDMTFLPFCGEAWTPVRETLYAFGQGMKTAIEVAVAAVETKKVKPYSKIIAVGGTGEGADTAIVVKTSPQNEAFGKDAKKRLWILEIIALPIEKL